MPDPKPTRPRTPPPGRLRRLDARLKLLLLLAACFVTQYAPNHLLAPWLCILGCLFLAREMRTAGVLTMLRGGIYFTAFWLAMKTGSDILDQTPPAEALTGALPLAGRLLALTVIGMAFVGLSSPLETGRAVAWYLWPLAGQRAWKPALVVALTSWFLPLTLRLAGEVMAAMRARGLKLSWRTSAMLVVGTALRILDGKAAELAAGLASRRLDDYRSWKWVDYNTTTCPSLAKKRLG